METRASDRLIQLGAEQEKADTRRRALEVLNDMLSRVERNGAACYDIDEMESSMKAFKRAEIIQDFEAKSWEAIINRLRLEDTDDDNKDGVADSADEDGDEADEEDDEEDDDEEEEDEDSPDDAAPPDDDEESDDDDS